MSVPIFKFRQGGSNGVVKETFFTEDTLRTTALETVSRALGWHVVAMEPEDEDDAAEARSWTRTAISALLTLSERNTPVVLQRSDGRWVSLERIKVE